MAAFLSAPIVFSLLVFSFSVSAAQRNITAKPGDDVILTCRAAENKDIVVVWWNRTDLESDHHVIMYRNKKIILEHQSPFFKDRVSLLDVKNGDVSLVLKKVTTDDTGRYECRVIQREDNRPKIEDTETISIINLRVEAAQRTITAKPGENVILTCRAAENKDVKVVEWKRTNQSFCVYWIDSFGEDKPECSNSRADLLDVKNGDVSLVLKNVTTDDTGRYECRIKEDKSNRGKRSVQDYKPICIIDLIVEPVEAGNNEDGPKEDGGNKTGLIAGLSVCAIVVLVVVVAVLLRRRQRNSSPRPEPPPAPEDEPLQDTPGL